MKGSRGWRQWMLALVFPGLIIARPASSSLGATSISYYPQATMAADKALPVLANVDDPSAVDAQDVCPGYKATNVQTTEDGLTADLVLAGEACNAYGIDIPALNLMVEYQADSRLHVQILPSVLTAANASYYTLSPDLVLEGLLEPGSHAHKELSFQWSNEPSFSFNVTRVSNGDVLFSTTGSQLVYENQFLEIVTSLPAEYNLYGLGEVIHSLRLGNNLTRTLWAANAGNTIDINTYGSHPIYMETRYDTAHGENRSHSHGVFLRNAHGQDVLLREEKLTWRALGGSLDLYFFSGPSPVEVIQQYQVVVGLPAMQRYHTLGLHQCRWGYANWSVVQEVIDNYARFNIPLENMWNDIDYMAFYRDFDNDPVRFGYSEGRKLIDSLHANGQYYIPIVDPGIYVPNPFNASDAYEPFTRGNESNAFLSNPDGSLFIGAVWPGYTAFPDWLDSSAREWWAYELQAWHDKLPWDGSWLDMSEAASDCAGSCGSGNLHLQPIITQTGLPGSAGNLVLEYPEEFNLTNATEAAVAASQSASELAAESATATASTSTSTTYVQSTPNVVRDVEYPPYVINNGHGALSEGAIATNATHHDGTLEYDIHNLFGLGEAQTTYFAHLAMEPNRRPFLITRSTFAGSGRYTGHWGGDNNSRWGSMWFAIPQALSFQLFGIPMFGVDTCGFMGNTDEELCNRWMQLSAFFPFYRNHNVLGAIPQEPYNWASVIEATITAQKVRFALLPYLYTLLYQAHATGSPVMRALAWNFPNDPRLADADTQFFLGDAILVIPVLEVGVSTVDGVFPGLVEGTDLYYDWYSQSKVDVPSTWNITISAPLGHIPVYIHGGNVLAVQDYAMTTRAARQTPWSIIVALDINQTAEGYLYLDDGESLVGDTKSVYFTADKSSLSVSVEGDFIDSNGLDTITILGLDSVPDGSVRVDGHIQDANITWNDTNNAAVIGVSLESAFQSSWTITWD
ncbi:hypothetical protein ASPZODRAFT_2122517 [Penicilliopsis zonata CBS 506.65]|uniref:alpha-glucosidase n=1 Tax=Penicilliopsis zonata CBS 506.65 TaxID=1073090 RepID=A0A1L9S564_9EURO|nr:hypothetical protein ASPZODRAFT_2122517 [Penicilliopsis zonata CBS 506.65]OJJ42298.1 hypothetical protein ASPZODRAFT_2122517 [Penicilliopsis zonata CBS 506.65]